VNGDGNSGYYNDNKIRPDKGYSRTDYDFARDPTTYDDALMRQAEKNVAKKWLEEQYKLLEDSPNYPDDPVGAPSHNCQDYVNRVREEYNRLKRENEKQRRCPPK
jgi:hypothetical protein